MTSIKAISSLVVLSTALVMASQALASPQSISKTLDEQRSDVLNALYRDGYFRSVTCPEFANIVLDSNGLPLIGHVSPIKGTRGASDRGRAKKSLPEFNDEITTANPVHQNVKISAAAIGSKQWQLKITRAPKGASGFPHPTESVFTFKVGEFKEKQDCELLSLAFKVDIPESKPTLAQIDCLDYFLLPKDHSAETPGNMHQIIKKDCALGLHYYKAIHDRLRGIAIE